MYLRILGSAAGGGYPQWNCACNLCRLVRNGGGTIPRRLHASLALSATGDSWHLINATPDVLTQINQSESLHPGPDLRQTPVKSIFLTDAELDHTIGLLLLREGSRLDVYAAETVLEALSESFPVRRMLSHYCDNNWISLAIGRSLPFEDNRLIVETIGTGSKRPRYASRNDSGSDWVIAYRFEDPATGGSLFYCPALESWSPEIESAIERSSCILIDGTFWSDDEMSALGAGKLSAAEMGHVPLFGTAGSITRLANFSSKKKLLIHINNTNPILDPNSRERQMLGFHGIEIGHDEMELTI